MAVPKKLAPLREAEDSVIRKSLKIRSSSSSTIPVYEIPDEIEDEDFSIDDFGILIYGPTGIGKSSLPKHAKNPFYFRFEQSSRSLKVRKTPIITHWNQALGWMSALEKDKKNTQTSIIDTGAPAYDRCLEGVCERLGITHPGHQKDYGASWKEIQKEFQLFFNRLAALNVGIWVTAHESIVDIETRSGTKYQRIQPNFGGKTLEFFLSCMDIIGYYFYVGTDRFLLIRGNDLVMAKCNLEENFMTPSGIPINAIPMGTTSEESYKNFIRAYNNLQTEPYSDIFAKGGIPTEIPAPAEVKKKAPLKKIPS